MKKLVLAFAFIIATSGAFAQATQAMPTTSLASAVSAKDIKQGGKKKHKKAGKKKHNKKGTSLKKFK